MPAAPRIIQEQSWIPFHTTGSSKLGAGGMGEVFLAEDTRLGRKVALKRLSASYQYEAEQLDEAAAEHLREGHWLTEM